MWVLDIEGDPVNLDRCIGITLDQSANHVQAVYGPDWERDRTIIFEGTPEEAREYHTRLKNRLTKKDLDRIFGIGQSLPEAAAEFINRTDHSLAEGE